MVTTSLQTVAVLQTAAVAVVSATTVHTRSAATPCNHALQPYCATMLYNHALQPCRTTTLFNHGVSVRVVVGREKDGA